MRTARRVLVVEDNPGDAAIILDLLEAQSMPRHTIRQVPSLAEAIGALEEFRPEVVLLDLRLPDGYGVDCVRALRRGHDHLPIVVLTGLEDDQLAINCLDEGAQDYLSKHELRGSSLGRALGYAIARSHERDERTRADTLQARLAAIVGASSDAIVSSTLDGIVTSWNSGAERIFGYSTEEAVGRPAVEVMRMVPAESRSDADRGLLRIGGDGGIGPVGEVVRLRRDGSTVNLSVVSSSLRDPDGRIVGLAVTCRDITELKQRDAELVRKNAELTSRSVQLRALTMRLHAVREEERTRISREVHDELGQFLTGIKMDLRWIGRRLPPRLEGSDDVAVKIDEAESLVDRTVERVQRIAVELRPSALDTLGLAAALRDEARRYEQRTGTRLEVDVRTASTPERDVSTAFFRIAQELLTNISRHAQARSVHITLDEDAGEWALSIEDDGVGVANDALDRPTSLGLVGVRERAEAFGGSFTLRRAGDHGTIASVTIPRNEAVTT
jgi:two-component system sensor histidine kinase UhpB